MTLVTNRTLLDAVATPGGGVEQGTVRDEGHG